jgi:hypothetical protein
MRKQGLIGLAILLLAVHPPVESAADQPTVLTAEGSHTIGNGETPAFAEAMALQNAKQAALEQAGIYVESYAKVKNQELAAEETESIAGGVLQVEVLERSRTPSPDGLQFHVKIKATVTPRSMDHLAERLGGRTSAGGHQKLAEDFAQDDRARERAWQLADLARNDAAQGDFPAARGRLNEALDTAAQIKGERKRTVALATIAGAQAEAGESQAALQTVASIPALIERDSLLRTLALDRAKAADLPGARRFAEAIHDRKKKAEAASYIEAQERARLLGF